MLMVCFELCHHCMQVQVYVNSSFLAIAFRFDLDHIELVRLNRGFAVAVKKFAPKLDCVLHHYLVPKGQR